MKQFLFYSFLLVSVSAYANPIKLTCWINGDDGKKEAWNLTVVAPSASSKGQVFSNDQNVNYSIPMHKRKLEYLSVTPSEIRYSVSNINVPYEGKQPPDGTLIETLEVSRVTGIAKYTTDAEGDYLKYQNGKKSAQSTFNCEPRVTNKF